MDIDVEAVLKPLLMRGVEGDSAAYREFLEGAYVYVLRMIERKSPHDFEDITQEILISLHDARHTFDPALPLAPWIAAIIRFRLHDSRRAYWRRKRRADALSESVAINTPTPAASDERLKDAFELLPVHHREVVGLLKLHGYSVTEVSMKLGITASAVKNRASRAYALLRTYMTEVAE